MATISSNLNTTSGSMTEEGLKLFGKIHEAVTLTLLNLGQIGEHIEAIKIDAGLICQSSPKIRIRLTVTEPVIRNISDQPDHGDKFEKWFGVSCIDEDLYHQVRFAMLDAFEILIQERVLILQKRMASLNSIGTILKEHKDRPQCPHCKNTFAKWTGSCYQCDKCGNVTKWVGTN